MSGKDKNDMSLPTGRTARGGRWRWAGLWFWPGLWPGLWLGLWLAACGLACAGAQAADRPAGHAAAGATAQDHRHGGASLNLRNADIRAFIDTVSKLTGKNFVVDPRVRGNVTVVSSSPITPDEVYQVFLSVLSVHGYTAVPSGGVTKIIPNAGAREVASPVASRAHPGHGDELVTRIIAVHNVAAASLAPVVKPLVPPQMLLAAYPPSNVIVMTGTAANVRRVARLVRHMDVANRREIRIVPLRYAAAASVAHHLKDLLTNPAKANNNQRLSLREPTIVADERTNSVLVVADEATQTRLRKLISQLDEPAPSSGNTRVVNLEYAKADDVAKLLTGMAGKAQKAKTPAPAKDAVEIESFPGNNALVITAPPDKMQRLLAIIRQLDVRRPQVLVKAIIAEVSNSLINKLGVQFSAVGESGARVGVIGTNFAASDLPLSSLPGLAQNPSNLASGLFLGAGRRSGNTFDFGVLLHALQSDTGSNVLSTPTLVTLDNQQASIVVAKKVPFVTGSYTSTGQGSTPQTPFQTIEREDVGITLKVKPQINNGKVIRLDIDSEVSSLTTAVGVAGNFITNKRNIQTSVLVGDAQTLVLGGLIENSYDNSEDKVPLLGDIPLLGNLFRYRSRKKVKTNLMIFIHPIVLSDRRLADRITRANYDRLRSIQTASGVLEDAPDAALPDFDDLILNTGSTSGAQALDTDAGAGGGVAAASRGAGSGSTR